MIENMAFVLLTVFVYPVTAMLVLAQYVAPSVRRYYISKVGSARGWTAYMLANTAALAALFVSLLTTQDVTQEGLEASDLLTRWLISYLSGLVVAMGILGLRWVIAR